MLNIKDIRLRNKISQDELAKISGISKRAIAGYEANETDISLKKLQNIALALNVSIFELFEESDKTTIKSAPIKSYLLNESVNVLSDSNHCYNCNRLKNEIEKLKDEKAELKKEIFEHIKYIGELEYQLRRARGETG